MPMHTPSIKVKTNRYIDIHEEKTVSSANRGHTKKSVKNADNGYTDKTVKNADIDYAE